MSPRPVVFFCMVGVGHFQRLWSLIAGLVARSVPVYVFTHPVCRELVTQAGGIFVDLFEGHSLDEADATSLPIPARSVSFAGHFGDAVARAVAALEPGLVVHDSFAVIGRVVAARLGVPRVDSSRVNGDVRADTQTIQPHSTEPQGVAP